MNRKPVLPGDMLGIFGGGQLGRFFVLAARQQGYRVGVIDPDTASPAGEMANEHWCASYTDPGVLRAVADQCAVVTTEFENAPADALATLSDRVMTAPGPLAVSVAQDRIREKAFLQRHGLPVAPCLPIECEADIRKLSDDFFPAILKISRFGYDGKGQEIVSSREMVVDAWRRLGQNACILEKQLTLDVEISVVFASGWDRSFVCFPVAENHHRHGILDVTIAPARISPALADEAVDAARMIASALDYVGVGAVEFFVSDGRLFVNEIAPRTHNSGHYTLNACDRSQFDLQLRAVCGWPLETPRLLSEAVMVNVLGDIWPPEGDPDWSVLLNEPSVYLSLYGKRMPKPGRKMGHFTVLGALPEALALANRCRRVLGIDNGDLV